MTQQLKELITSSLVACTLKGFLILGSQPITGAIPLLILILKRRYSQLLLPIFIVAFLQRFAKNLLKVVQMDIGILKVIILEEQYTMKQVAVRRFSTIMHIGLVTLVAPLPVAMEMHGLMKQCHCQQ